MGLQEWLPDHSSNLQYPCARGVTTSALTRNSGSQEAATGAIEVNISTVAAIQDQHEVTATTVTASQQPSGSWWLGTGTKCAVATTYSTVHPWPCLPATRAESSRKVVFDHFHLPLHIPWKSIPLSEPYSWSLASRESRKELECLMSAALECTW